MRQLTQTVDEVQFNYSASTARISIVIQLLQYLVIDALITDCIQTFDTCRRCYVNQLEWHESRDSIEVWNKDWARYGKCYSVLCLLICAVSQGNENAQVAVGLNSWQSFNTSIESDSKSPIKAQKPCNRLIRRKVDRFETKIASFDLREQPFLNCTNLSFDCLNSCSFKGWLRRNRDGNCDSVCSSLSDIVSESDHDWKTWMTSNANCLNAPIKAYDSVYFIYSKVGPNGCCYRLREGVSGELANVNCW